eukprot:764692-Rhodomonas_salina.3
MESKLAQQEVPATPWCLTTRATMLMRCWQIGHLMRMHQEVLVTKDEELNEVRQWYLSPPRLRTLVSIPFSLTSSLIPIILDPCFFPPLSSPLVPANQLLGFPLRLCSARGGQSQTCVFGTPQVRLERARGRKRCHP